METLRSYLNSLTPDQQKEYAKRCLTSVGYLRKAISESQPINPKTCAKLEKESDSKVLRRDLRPNDWQEIWPELVDVA